MNGDDIRQAREARGWTQQQLAAKVGVGQRTIGSWERGETVPKNRMGRLIEIFREDETRDSPLRGVSDAELLAELARRMQDGRLSERRAAEQ